MLLWNGSWSAMLKCKFGMQFVFYTYAWLGSFTYSGDTPEAAARAKTGFALNAKICDTKYVVVQVRSVAYEKNGSIDEVASSSKA